MKVYYAMIVPGRKPSVVRESKQDRVPVAGEVHVLEREIALKIEDVFISKEVAVAVGTLVTHLPSIIRKGVRELNWETGRFT